MKRLERGDFPESPPITPESIEADDRLTDEEKAIAYDLLFEYHGDDEDEG